MRAHRLGWALALGLSSPAPAEEPVRLPPVVVPAPAPAPGEQQEPPPEAAARRDPSSAVTVIRVDGHPEQARDTAELLAAAPGVVVQDLGGLGQTKSVSIRGASPTGVLVMLDGIPLNGAGGIAELSRLPLALAESMEVLRGGAGARYGSGGLGGVVNVLTPEAKGLRAHAQLSLGSFGTGLAEAGATGPLLGGQALVLLHGGRTAGDFAYLFDETPVIPDDPLRALTRENNDAGWGGALVKYRTALGGWTAHALAELSFDRRGLAGTVHFPTIDARQEGRRVAASVRAARPLGDSAELSLRAHLRWDDEAFSGGYFGTAVRQRLLSGAAAADASLLVAGWHALSATAELGGDALEESTGRDPAWAKAALMAMDEVLLLDGQLVLAPSLRVDLVGRFVTLSPKLGATATLPWGLEARANLGQAHRAPSFLELYVVQGSLLPNPLLRPERALTADLQLGWRAPAGPAVSVAAFGSLYEDLISYEYYPPFLARAYNFATAAVYGVEAAGEAGLPLGAAISAAYTLLFSLNLRDEPRYFLKALPFRPRHSLRAQLSGGPEWLTGRLEVRAQSEQFINRTEEGQLPARALVHASVESVLPFSRWMRLTVQVKNVFDVHAQDVDGYPLPGRSFYAGLRAELGDRSPSQKPSQEQAR